ncbi:MAG: cobalamin-dependent protein, partial [Kiritimatiellales bacterium]
MDIVFSTFNARYSHTALALRCLRANLGNLRDRSVIVEFDNGFAPQAAAEKLLAHDPEIVLFSVYIWNLTVTAETAAILRTVSPNLRIVIGGPEVSYEYEELAIFRTADHLICGEGEAVIEPLCRALLQGKRDACDTSSVPQASSPPCLSSVSQASRLPCFNPVQDVRQSRRKSLPHWTQDGCTYFVTFRLADSIAQSRISEYNALREKWKEHHHPPYTENEKEQFNKLFSEQVNSWLDEGAGACILRNPEISKIVADTLTHFDSERYELDEWVVMPNHVNVLVTPLSGFDLKDILHSWKSFSAHAINEITGQKGAVWKHESYDHIVRNQEELLRIRKYIRDNPAKAGCSAEMRQGKRDACGTANVSQASRLPCPNSISQTPCPPKVIEAPPVDLKTIALPYDEYTDDDIAHRRIYVETSRGCPFKCEYC